MVLGLFGHTDQGSRALKEVLGLGVDSETIAVIGDLGIPAGEAGAMHHVTLDRMHVPAAQRDRFMDGIRGGGVVLAVSGAASAGVAEVLRRHGAELVEETPDAGAATSHNVAG